jgi:hypothetical protein
MLGKSGASLCFVLLVVLTTQQTQQTIPSPDYYKNWNDNFILSGVLVNPDFSKLSSGLPSTLNPSNAQVWSRSKTTLSSAQLTDRYTHYRYFLNSNNQCTFSCGLRSFLVKINGLLVCQRDNTNSFWGSSPLNSYDQYCVPDSSCSINLMNLGILQYSKGRCSSSTSLSNGYKAISSKIDCCWKDNEQNSLLLRNIIVNSAQQKLI